MGTMQESMLKMHEQIHARIDVKNPQARERLMQDRWHMVPQHMETMKDDGMMGGEAKSSMDAGK